MAENIQQSVEVPVGLSIFGSLITEMSPSDLPEGVSPDNQDIIYLPGNVLSRPGMEKLFASGTLPNGATITYGKNFTLPNGNTLNFFLDSFGNLWKQDVLNTPLVLVKIGSVVGSGYCNSISAFGKEFFTFHNGVNGIDIPRQYDGTNLDRVTQGGPGAPPVLANTLIAGQALHAVGAGSTVNITSVTVSDRVRYTIPHEPGDPGFIFIYTTLTFVTATPHGFTAGETVDIASVTTWSGAPLYPMPSQAVVTTVIDPNTFKIAFYDENEDSGTDGTVGTQGAMLSRTNNVVSGATLNPHGLQIGYQVAIAGVANSNVGGGITGAVIASSEVTVTTTNAHGLVPGCSVYITGSSGAILDGNYVVQTCPSPTTFTIINYSADQVVPGGGNVQDIWNGTFFVASIPTDSTFTYDQLGPNDSATGTGTATPYGQISPGPHSCVVLFQTRNGLVTAPSTPTQLYANGGQYLTITNIPIGPPNVIARILAFTGSGGSRYFYIPVPVISNGQQVSGSTVINDNTTTSAILDFSDAALFNGISIDSPGNNLFALKTLAPCLGVFYYASRLFFWGNYNYIQNLLNMGFEGGYLFTTPTVPLGWAVETTGGTLINSPTGIGMAWRILGDGVTNPIGRISQPAFQDYLKVSIINPLTNYSILLWVSSSVDGGNLTVDLYSPSLATVLSTASVNLTESNGSFLTADFSAQLGQNLPSDIVLRVYASGIANGQVVVVDEIFPYLTDNPYNQLFDISYIENPESIDSVTGQLGTTEDVTPIMTCFIQRGTLFFLTQRGLHSTRDSASSEPSGWTVNAISLDSGTCSVRGCTTGENFAAWVSSPRSAPPSGIGLYLYTGGDIVKVSQEVQTLFDSSNQDWLSSVWVKNDPILRRIYIALPQDMATAPNIILPLDYRELNTVDDINSRPPVHISFTGKMICSDLSRKWTRWNVSANFGEMLKMGDGSSQFCVGAGNGAAPGDEDGFANVYHFNSSKLTDDDYGVITPYYVTYFFVNHETEQMLQVGLHRKLFRRWDAFIQGVGRVTITPYVNSLNNPRANTPSRVMSANPLYDIGGGLNVSGERVAFKIASTPLPGQTDNSFSLQKFIITLMAHPTSPLRFGAI